MGIFKPSVTISVSRLTCIDDEIVKLLEILTPLEPLKRHQDVKFPRTENAGSWLLKLESFRKWRDNDPIEVESRVFCCYGIPGAGKTVIWYGTKPLTELNMWM